MRLKYRLRARKVEDPPRVVVHPFFDLGHLLVGQILEARTLWSEAPDHFVYVFIGAALVCAVRVAVVELCPLFAFSEAALLHALAVGKLGTIVAGDTFEDDRKHFTVTPFQIVESSHDAGGAFVHELPHDFLPAHAFAEYEQHLFTRAGAYYGIHFPVSEGFTIVDFLRALFYAFPLWRSGRLLYGMIALFFVGLDREVFICQIKKDPLVYVAVNGGFAFDLRVKLEALYFDFAQDSLWAVLFLGDLVFDILGQFVVCTDL